MYSALCLPRRREAISLARRPRVLPSASTTYQSRFTVSGLATKVFMLIITYLKNLHLRNTRVFPLSKSYHSSPLRVLENSWHNVILLIARGPQ
ncbi:hypothetical protein VCRA2114E122_50115 [Vibrio crassostreae]|nr:hypothetical protein VCRA2114E122_50115 [Vibrio crassostreae]